MTGDVQPVRRLQILLHETCRTADARAAAMHAIEQAGMTVSGEGAATLSVRMSNADFEKIFPARSQAQDELAVPDKLRPFVASISEAPEHISFE